TTKGERGNLPQLSLRAGTTCRSGRRFGGSRLGRGGGSRALDGGSGFFRPAPIDELDNRKRRVVAAARTELHDPGVTARAPLEALGQIHEHFLDQVDLLRLAILEANAEARDVGP